jgi:hypothetical protein
MKPMRPLTAQEAYIAMHKYLEHLYALTNSDDLAGLLGSMSLLPDGHPADPAVWIDWTRIVQEVIEGQNDISFTIKGRNG